MIFSFIKKQTNKNNKGSLLGEFEIRKEENSQIHFHSLTYQLYSLDACHGPSTGFREVTIY
jgi:hypothetical protein